MYNARLQVASIYRIGAFHSALVDPHSSTYIQVSTIVDMDVTVERTGMPSMPQQAGVSRPGFFTVADSV